MKQSFLMLASILCLMESANSQSSDVLVLKRKDGRRVASLMQGGIASLRERTGARYSGRILRIEKDTIRMEIYDIRTIGTPMGGVLFDTISRQPVKIDYRDIEAISKPTQSFRFVRNGFLMKWSGIAFASLHLLNAAIYKEPVIWDQLAVAGTVTATGILLGRLYRDEYIIGRRYAWQYIDL
jgi:hypothetical protein